MKENEQILRDLWDINYVQTVGVSEGKERKKGAKRLFEEILAGNFPNLI